MKLNYSLIAIITLVLATIVFGIIMASQMLRAPVRTVDLFSLPTEPSTPVISLEDQNKELEMEVARLKADNQILLYKLQGKDLQIEELNRQIQSCGKGVKIPSPPLDVRSTEADELRGILVAMSMADSLQEEAEPDPPLDDKSVDPLPDDYDEGSLIEENLDEEVQPIPPRNRDPLRFGANIGTGMGLDKEGVVTAGVHAVNKHLLLGAEFVFRGDIVLFKVGWQF